MSLATLETAAGRWDVIAFRMVRPLVGPWRCEVEADTGDQAWETEAGRVTLTIAGRAFVGWATCPAALGGRGRAVVVGGLGGWATSPAARDYQDALPSTMIEDLSVDVGEAIEPASLAALPLSVFGRWHRAEAVAGVSLGLLAARLGLSWRITDAGQTWIGAETWPTAPPADVLPERAYGDDGALAVAPLSLSIEPGMTWTDGRRIGRVIYSMQEGGALEAELLFVRDTATPDVQRAAFERAVRAVLRELPFLGRYPAAVAEHGAAGIELQPDDPSQAGTPPLPPLYGLPGVRCTVPAGARGGLVYEAADPARGRVLGWDEETPATRIEVTAGGTATRLDSTGWEIPVSDPAAFDQAQPVCLAPAVEQFAQQATALAAAQQTLATALAAFAADVGTNVPATAATAGAAAGAATALAVQAGSFSSAVSALIGTFPTGFEATKARVH